MTLDPRHLYGLRQLDREALLHPPGHVYIATLANQFLEERLLGGTADEIDIERLEQAAQRAGR